MREHVFVRRGPRYSEDEARAAIVSSTNYSQALRKLGMRPAGGNHETLRRYAEQVWKISTAHFDPHAARREALARANPRRPIEEFLVEGSACCRTSLKKRLLREGLKQPICELCGQGEIWRGRRMSLILDHINGVGDDNRIENLRMVCPNCAATLDTHCARKLRLPPRECARCGVVFQPNRSKRRYCSSACGSRWDRSHLAGPRPDRRKVERPPYDQLVAEIQATNYCAVGRKYGVSDNAIRKWIRAYEDELRRAA
jgi:hypothetical protein